MKRKTNTVPGHNTNLGEEVRSRLPGRIEVYTEHGTFRYDLGDVTREPDILRVAYNGVSADRVGDVLADGEPDFVNLDIHFTRHGGQLKTLVNVTYGDAMKSEFSLMAPNRVRVGHYEGDGSMADPDSHFGFSDGTLDDLVGLFNSFDPGYRFKRSDFAFIDSRLDSYEHNESAKISPLSPAQAVLLIDNSKPPRHRFVSRLKDYLRTRGIEYVSVSSMAEAEALDRRSVMAVIMSGSDRSIEDSPENQRLYRWATERFDCPTLAICYGAQTMMRHRGASVLRGNLVHDNMRFTEFRRHPLLDGLDCTRAQFSFSFKDFVRVAPAGFQVVARVGKRVALAADDERREYALFFHPENMDHTHRVLDNFMRMVHPAQAEQDKILSGKFESLSHIRRFDEFGKNKQRK